MAPASSEVALVISDKRATALKSVVVCIQKYRRSFGKKVGNAWKPYKLKNHSHGLRYRRLTHFTEFASSLLVETHHEYGYSAFFRRPFATAL